MSNYKSHSLPVPRGAVLHEVAGGRTAFNGWVRACAPRLAVWWAAAAALMARAEQRITENFRVPPGGG